MTEQPVCFVSYSASDFVGSAYSPQVKNSQVLKSLLTPQVAISPMVCNWSQYGAPLRKG